MSKPTRGTPVTVSPRSPAWPWLVLVVAALIGGYLLFARPNPVGKATPKVSTGRWAPVEPPGWVDSPEARAGNDKLTGPDGFEFADTKRVKTLRVTPGGVVEKADGR